MIRSFFLVSLYSFLFSLPALDVEVIARSIKPRQRIMSMSTTRHGEGDVGAVLLDVCSILNYVWSVACLKCN